MKSGERFVFLLPGILSLFILHCDRVFDPPGLRNETPGPGEAETYVVYGTVLNSFSDERRVPYFVLSDSTVCYDISNRMDHIKNNIPELSDETILSYVERNRQRVRIAAIPGVSVRLDYLSTDHGGEWPGWREVYPDADALIHFSRVGFNGAMDQALVYFSDYSGPLAASGNLIFLEKEKTWTVKRTVMVWIS